MNRAEDLLNPTQADQFGQASAALLSQGSQALPASTSSTLSQVVAKAGTSTRLTSSLNPSRSGNSVTFTVTVSTSVLGLGAPTGTVTFRDEGRTLGTVALNGSGKAIYTIASLSRGTHWISAVYSGNGNFSDSLDVLLQQVNR